MSSKIMNKIQKSKTKNDVIYTPELIVDLMISFSDYKNESVLDSCRGKGAFYNKLNSPKFYCEISEGVDFFNFNEFVELSIGNPPYSILDKWLNHTYKICNRFCYIVGMYSLTTPRLKKMEENGFYITKMLLVNVPTWFQRSYILVCEKLDKKPHNIIFDFKYLGNKCLWCNHSVGGMRGDNIKHCKRKMSDLVCSY